MGDPERSARVSGLDGPHDPARFAAMIAERTAVPEWLRYAVAVLGYIGLAMLTKRFLTWTYGPIYFVTVLEVLPRVYRRVRSWLPTRRALADVATGSEP